MTPAEKRAWEMGYKDAAGGLKRADNPYRMTVPMTVPIGICAPAVEPALEEWNFVARHPRDPVHPRRPPSPPRLRRRGAPPRVPEVRAVAAARSPVGAGRRYDTVAEPGVPEAGLSEAE